MTTLVACLILTGCSGGAGAGDDGPTPAQPKSRPSAASPAPWEPQSTRKPVKNKHKDAVLAAYRAYWRAAAAAEDPPRPDAAGLRQWATGDELARIRAELAANQLHEVSRTGRYLIDPVVVAVDHDQATIADCFTPYRWVKGEDKPEPPPPPIPLRATLTLAGSVWKVAKTEPGMHSCSPAANR